MIKIFELIKKVFFAGLTILSIANPLISALPNAIPLSTPLLKCVSMTNQKCKARTEIVNVNSGEPVFYPFSIKTSKCSDSCNNINDPYATMCVPDVIKNINVKIFKLTSRTNETRYIKWHETCKCKCDQMQAFLCNNKHEGVNAKN